MAKRQAFIANRGETFTLSVSGITLAGDPIDLTGHTLTFVVKNSAGVELEEYSQVVSAMPVTIKAPVSEVATWPLGNNKFLLKSEAPNGDVRYWVYGPLTVREVD